MLFTIASCAYSLAILFSHPASRTTDELRRQGTQHAPVSQRAKARNADQKYLRAIVNQLEAQRASVHAMMSTPAGHASHGTAMDPAAWDTGMDGQQREALTLLKHDYGETLSPLAPPPTPSPRGSASSGAEATDAHGAEEGKVRGLVALTRETIALTDKFAPKLRRASTRDLARRVRRSQASLLKQLSPGASR